MLGISVDNSTLFLVHSQESLCKLIQTFGVCIMNAINGAMIMRAFRPSWFDPESPRIGF